jgi:DNA-binding XRE family transcriptional regulator
MENEPMNVFTFGIELERIRKQLGFSRNDFALLFNVSRNSIDAWCKRNVQPRPSNAQQIVNFMEDLRKTQKAIGLIVVSDKATKNAEPLKTHMILKHYCENNRLELVTYKIVTKAVLHSHKSIAEIFDLSYIKSNSVTDFVIFSKPISLSATSKKELKDSGIKIIHSFFGKAFAISKISD